MTFLAGRPPTPSSLALYGKKIAIGKVSVDGAQVDTIRSKAVALPAGLFTRTPDCFLVCSSSTVPGTVNEVTVSDTTATGFTINLSRDTDTVTSAFWAAISDEVPTNFRAGQIPTADDLNGFEFEIQHGDIRLDTSTPGSGGNIFTGHVDFPAAFASPPVVFVNAISSVPGGTSGMIECSATNETTTGFDVYTNRGNTTGHRVNWVAIGAKAGGAGFYNGLRPKGRELSSLGLNRKVAQGSTQMTDDVAIGDGSGQYRFTTSVQLPRGMFRATPHIVLSTNSTVPGTTQIEATVNDDTPSQFDIKTARGTTTQHRTYYLAVGD